MAIFCTRYLTSALFSATQTSHEIRTAALSGYYGALDYAAACWKKHVQKVCCGTVSNKDLDEETKNTVLQSAQDLLDAQVRLARALEPGSDREQDTTSEQLPQ